MKYLIYIIFAAMFVACGSSSSSDGSSVDAIVLPSKLSPSDQK